MDEKKSKKGKAKTGGPGFLLCDARLQDATVVSWPERGDASVLNLPFFVNNPFLRMECMQFQSECYDIILGFDFVDGVVVSFELV